MEPIFNILFFYLLGAIISDMIGGLFPASVIGMILLFAALTLKWIKPERIKPATDFLLSNLMLFFVPIAAGVVGSFMLFKEHIWAIVVSALVSTVLVVGSVGLIAQLLIKHKEKK